MPILTGTRSHSPTRTRAARAQLPEPHGRCRGRAVPCRVTAGPRGLTVPPATPARDLPLAARVLRGAERKPFTPSCNTPCCVSDINKHSPTLQLI